MGVRPTTRAPTPHMSLLIVDDSATMGAMITRAVGASGLPVGCIHEAADGRQALAVLEQHHIDDLEKPFHPEAMRDIRCTFVDHGTGDAL